MCIRTNVSHLIFAHVINVYVFFHFFPSVLLPPPFIIFFLFLLFSFMFPPFFIVLFSTCTWQILSFFIWIITGHRSTGEKENSSNISFQLMWIMIQNEFTNEWTCELVDEDGDRNFFLQLTWFFFSLSTSILYFSSYDLLYFEKLEIELNRIPFFFLIIKIIQRFKNFFTICALSVLQVTSWKEQDKVELNFHCFL